MMEQTWVQLRKGSFSHCSSSWIGKELTFPTYKGDLLNIRVLTSTLLSSTQVCSRLYVNLMKVNLLTALYRLCILMCSGCVCVLQQLTYAL